MYLKTGVTQTRETQMKMHPGFQCCTNDAGGVPTDDKNTTQTRNKWEISQPEEGI